MPLVRLLDDHLSMTCSFALSPLDRDSPASESEEVVWLITKSGVPESLLVMNAEQLPLFIVPGTNAVINAVILS